MPSEVKNLISNDTGEPIEYFVIAERDNTRVRTSKPSNFIDWKEDGSHFLFKPKDEVIVTKQDGPYIQGGHKEGTVGVINRLYVEATHLAISIKNPKTGEYWWHDDQSLEHYKQINLKDIYYE